MRVLFIFGTRPEAIKMAPLVRAFKKQNKCETLVCVTAQHRKMLDQVLELFEITPDFDLDLMTSNQTLEELTSKVLLEVSGVIDNSKPDWIFVHGDTTTSMVASLAAFYKKVPVAHVEAGLRTYNLNAPWPEEANRQITSVIAKLHFAPTLSAKQNLLKEGKTETSIFVTGNTVIDALIEAQKILNQNIELKQKLDEEFKYLNSDRKLILVTGHRRENFGDGFEQICTAIKKLSERHDIEVLYPVHLNPKVQEPVQRILAGSKNIHLIEPVDYLRFTYLMARSYLILTDSGGVQEEAPSLGKPVLVMRETTERPEAVTAGTVRLVGSNSESILSAALDLIENKKAYDLMSKSINPYGDGKACEKIISSFFLQRP